MATLLLAQPRSLPQCQGEEERLVLENVICSSYQLGNPMGAKSLSESQTKALAQKRWHGSHPMGVHSLSQGTPLHCSGVLSEGLSRWDWCNTEGLLEERRFEWGF